MCSDLLSHLLGVRDPRADWNKSYPLEEILLLCICAVSSGAEGWKAIAEFREAKWAWLRRFAPFENAIPSPDCLGWVMARLPAKAFQDCFLAWRRSVAQRTEGEVVAIDGKTLRGSHDRGRGQAAIHLVSAWASGNRLCLGPTATAAKYNEITAIPALFKLLELKDCIVTIDAMGCQTTIAEQIVA
jgi:hypothetical protein